LYVENCARVGWWLLLLLIVNLSGDDVLCVVLAGQSSGLPHTSQHSAYYHRHWPPALNSRLACRRYEGHSHWILPRSWRSWFV